MKLLPIALLVAAVSMTASVFAQQSVSLDFASSAHDLAVDASRSRVYVSLPDENRVAIVDSNSWVEIGSIGVAPRPQGLALSIDSSRLFVAKNGAGSVAVVDLVTLGQSDIQLTTLLDDPRTYDVIEARPGELFVSSNPSSNGFAYIVKVDLLNGNAAERVASNRIIRCAPTFEVNADRTSLYVGACFSPASMYRLDLTQANAPIVAEDDHGSVGGTLNYDLNPNGSTLHLRTGQILDADTLDVIGQVGDGIPRFDIDPNRVFVTGPTNTVETWNTVSQTQIDSVTVPCAFGTFSSPTRFAVLEGEVGFIALVGSQLCGIADVAPCVASVESICASTVNSTGAPALLQAIGEPRIAQNQFSLELSSAPPETYSLMVFGAEPAQLPFGDGWLCISPFGGIQRFGSPARVGSNGRLTQHLDFQSAPLVNTSVIAYSTWIFQTWYRDSAAMGTGANTSDALQITFCP
jgi:hypothetical protein